MKRIALYGGSFDPPHLGHVITIAAVLNSKLVDEVWLVPTGRHRDKEHHATPDDRKIMIGIMLATMFGSKMPVYLNVSQINRSWQISTTADLIGEMKKIYPGHDFSFVIGSDLVSDIPKWHKADQIMKEGMFLMVQRLGNEVSGELPAYVTAVPVKGIALTNISSSLVRKMIANGQSLEGVVPPAVIGHILRNSLYLEQSTTDVSKPILINEGRFIKFMSLKGWEYVQRNNCTGVVVIVAVTENGKILLTEQYRIPVGKKVIELPAGLVNDSFEICEEHIEEAAERELLEETGYKAGKIFRLTEGPISAGLCSEVITFVRAEDLKKEGAGGGDTSESIIVHEVSIDHIEEWLMDMQLKGVMVDPKVYAGLYFVKTKNYLKRNQIN